MEFALKIRITIDPGTMPRLERDPLMILEVRTVSWIFTVTRTLSLVYSRISSSPFPAKCSLPKSHRDRSTKG
jgi:hypothetical protein